MKAILLAFVAGVFLLAIGSWRLRRRHIDESGSRILTTVFLAILPVLAAAHLLTPSGLGFLPPELQIPLPAVDFSFALLLYIFGFFGGILQLYNLAERGFSLRILIDVLQSPSGTTTTSQVIKDYGAGRGIQWMYDKRVDGMKHTGLVVERGDHLALTKGGRRTARVFDFLQRLANAEDR